MSMIFTNQLAEYAGYDAGNANMMNTGRTKWSEEDREAALAEYQRLFMFIEFEPGSALGAVQAAYREHLGAQIDLLKKPTLKKKKAAVREITRHMPSSRFLRTTDGGWPIHGE